jgi:hypothetical protein
VRRWLDGQGPVAALGVSGGSRVTGRRRSQSMFLPVIVMGVGFILFLLYPLILSIQIG